eukprot:TRINITY_DN11892_c0_g1_i1.p1 TRINITY_DN11892_c0_g1~~TRINITY_DN11892_c0_g1_i1.p1  ORF type:complete len:112 (-),score=23.79 TRINITY_DN11892_c0_g1_i1:29-325(-)
MSDRARIITPTETEKVRLPGGTIETTRVVGGRRVIPSLGFEHDAGIVQHEDETIVHVMQQQMMDETFCGMDEEDVREFVEKPHGAPRLIISSNNIKSQ